jgi:signal transduction histidine kinase
LDTISELRPDAERKKLSLEFTAPDETCHVSGDEKKIRDHVVRNLIDNAIRYTSHGSIQIILSRVDNLVVLLVADTGIGISENDKERLFTEGGRGAKSTTTNPSSTGYGLYIAKSVIGAHSGTIWAQSKGPGTGSQFYVCLPVSDAPSHA